MNFMYTIDGYVVSIIPYRPFYELCQLFNSHKIHYYKEIPPFPEGTTRRFTFAKGWSDPIPFTEIPDAIQSKIKKAQDILQVYHKLLDFENSCKMRYIPMGFGNELMYSLLEQDEALLETFAETRGQSIEAAKKELQLRKQELSGLFIFLLETRKKVKDLIDEEKYDEALAYVKREISRLNI